MTLKWCKEGTDLFLLKHDWKKKRTRHHFVKVDNIKAFVFFNIFIVYLVFLYSLIESCYTALLISKIHHNKSSLLLGLQIQGFCDQTKAF